MCISPSLLKFRGLIMTNIIQDSTNSILIEVTNNSDTTPGMRDVAFTPGNLLNSSAEMLDSSMEIIETMSNRITSTITNLAADNRPSNVEASFGLRINAEGNAYVAKTGVEATINIKLTWKHVNNNEE